MEIKNLFKRPIDREIKGVIKIGQSDEENIYQELEEYVVTEELQGHFSRFFEAYDKSAKQSTDQMGVWISGFFGSGKSHFLKILSYLLDSKQLVAEQRPVDFFIDKINNPELLETMQRVSQQNNEVILFNIDSKSDADNKQNKLAIVKVFNKVFNEMRGYSASIPWLAQLEEILAENGEYENFKTAFENESGLSWEECRDEIYYNEDEMVKALMISSEMSEESARRWIENGESNYEISVESFAKRIEKYVNQQDNDYHLVFLADEMGQYIANNIQLMLNLQTVVEDLGKLTKGKVWVIVTSQQDIDSLNEGGISANDFSKIQGRFNTRLSLSSANADEVIKKRLLTKNEVAAETLAIEYTEFEAALRNKIIFSENTAEMRGFANGSDFIEVYPFVPYQFNLLQKVFTGIREHGSSGKHLADGERNLLEAIQQAALLYKSENTGFLVPFQTFYESIDQALEHSVRAAIIKAKQSEKLEPFDVDVLKLLFLIRYVKEMPSNLENVTTLMVQHVDEDKLTLSKKIAASFDRLQRQFLIQRNGQEYLFLTNEEQDVNREIQHMQVSNAQVVSYLGNVIFQDILEMKRYTYLPFENQRSVSYNFDVATWIDERSLSNSAADIGIRILSSYYGETDSPEAIAALSTRVQQVIVILDENGTYYEDTINYLKIYEYIRSNSSKSGSPLMKEIILRKSTERNELTKSIKTQLTSALENSTLLVNGMVQKSTASNSLAKIEKGLHTLIESMYLKINYITEFYDQERLDKLVKDTQGNIFGDLSDDPNHLATKELERYIENHTDRKMMVTVRELIQVFSEKPNGWREMDVLASLIRLLKTEKIHLTMDTKKMNLIDPLFVRTLTKRASQEKIALTKREVIQDKYLKVAKNLVKDTTGTSITSEKEDAIILEIKERYSKRIAKLAELKMNYKFHYYPGEKTIERGLISLNRLVQIEDANEFFKEIYQQENEILDIFDDLQPVENFFEHNIALFDESMKLKNRFEKDESLLNSEAAKKAGKRLQEIMRIGEPYGLIKELPQLNQIFKEAIVQELEESSTPVLKSLEESYQVLLNETKLSNYLQNRLETGLNYGFTNLREKIEKAETISELNSFSIEIQNLTRKYLKQIEDLKLEEQAELEVKKEKLRMEKAAREKAGEAVQEEPEEFDDSSVSKLPESKIFQRQELIPQTTVELTNSIDLEKYLEQIRKKVEYELQQGKTVKII